MGILRTDRVSGLGGANAIKGSVFFGNSISEANAHGYNYLITERSDNFTFGTGDITIEGWFFFPRLSSSTNYQALVGDTTYSSNGGFTFYIEDGQLNFWKGTSTSSVVSGGTIVQNQWTHLAYTRESGSNKIFVNGSLVGTASDSTDYTDTVLTIGSNNVTQTSGSDAGKYSLSGFASNVRVLKGRALYTAAFTPPVGELQVIDNTVLLCCQSPGNVLQEATGVILTAPRINNSIGAQASRFTPNSPVGFSTTTDVGTQFGSTFDGVTTFDSQAYMVPPGGNTRERNRGTALFGGASTTDDVIQKILIQSTGNAEDFGDLSGNRYETECAASSTRGVFAGGYTEDTSPNQKVNIIEFVTIASPSNATDFGDLTVQRGHTSGASNSTRGVIAGGSAMPSPYPVTNVIDFFTIATTGNASDFGDTTSARKFMGGGRSSTTRALFCGGDTPDTNAIDFVTIATTGNAQDFGDCTQIGWAKGAGNVSSGTRAVLAGGYDGSANINVIEFLTIATLGNGTDFGDLAVATRATYAAGSKTRGIFGGGKQNPASATTNTISFITIATTGDASDFGDMINSKAFGSGLSDCHGGLE